MTMALWRKRYGWRDDSALFVASVAMVLNRWFRALLYQIS